jgi:beta-glucosidase
MTQTRSILKDLSLAEKVALLSGADFWTTVPIEGASIPSIKVTDGPNGARGDAVSGTTSACFPVGVALAATWNKSLVHDVGRAIGEEAITKDAQVLLAPTVNLHRTPLGGRNFECYSEDPLLTGAIATSYVQGVQSAGVGACVKHFVGNESEYHRHTMSSEIDERTLREIYLAPFEMVVRDAKPWSIMSAYNRVNGTYASSSTVLLKDILKTEWAFDGVVISDWGASLETEGNANGGLDLEMPGPARTFGSKLISAVENGDVPIAEIDDKVARLLWLIERSGKFDQPDRKPERSLDKPDHRAIARQAAAEAIVLVKNKGLLPIDLGNTNSIAIIGPNAERGQIQGGGSAGVSPHYQVHPLEGIRTAIGNKAELSHEVGCLTHKYLPAPDMSLIRPDKDDERSGLNLRFFPGEALDGAPAQERISRRNKLMFPAQMLAAELQGSFSATLSGIFTPEESGDHEFGIMSAGLSRLFINGELVIDNWTEQTRGDSFFAHGSTEKRGTLTLEKDAPYDVRIEFQQTAGALVPGLQYGVLPPQKADMFERAIDAAGNADIALLMVGTNADWETEGNDRQSLDLPGAQRDLIEKVIEANPNTVVVLNTGAPVAMPWLDKSAAVLQTWFPGQEYGNALADVLFGVTNPSGKMPTTWPRRLEDTPAFTSYPGDNEQVRYAEGVFVGHRWYDARQTDPLIPFGHGLSYTTFEYADLNIEKPFDGTSATISFEISNAGEFLGSEVAQVYLGDQTNSVQRPPKELKEFAKIKLQPGETKRVSLDLDRRAFSYWDSSAHQWKLAIGIHHVSIGASSRDIRMTEEIRIET